MSGSPRPTSTLLLASRVILLVAAAAAVVIAFAATRAHESPGAPAVQYSCAMHPQVTSAKPGECPICRMALERVRTAAAPADPRAADAAPFRSSYDVMWARPRPAPREMRAPAWVDDDGDVVALFYNDEIAALDAGERGELASSRAPGSVWTVRLTDAPPVRRDEATSPMSLTVVPGGARPAAGTVGWVKLAPRARNALVVPDSAVLQSPAAGNRRAPVGFGMGPGGNGPNAAGREDDRPGWKPGRGATSKTGAPRKVARHKRHPRMGA